MKNAIKYYYNIEVTSIRQKNKCYTVETNDNIYMLINYDGNDIEYIQSINEYLIYNNIKTNEIIHNLENKLITNINGDMYVLLKINIPIRKITENDIIEFNNIVFDETNYDWFDLWTKKIDYLEYQISQKGLKYKLIRDSFSYYIGLSELSIILIKNIKSDYYCLSHKRINYNDTTFELYNPLNYISDYRFRDMCEYYKSSFFNNIDVTQSIKNYLNYLDDKEKYLFFIRLIFPSYYFDYYEKVINDEIEEKELNKIIKRINDYELLIKNIYYYLGNILPEIEWIKKVIQH